MSRSLDIHPSTRLVQLMGSCIIVLAPKEKADGSVEGRGVGSIKRVTFQNRSKYSTIIYRL